MFIIIWLLYLKPEKGKTQTQYTWMFLEGFVSSAGHSSPPLPLGVGLSSTAQSMLSRPMQRKLVTLVHCQLVEEEGRVRAMRAARSLGERTVTELILQHQNPQQLSSNLWAAVRARGCQFLGPGRSSVAAKEEGFRSF